MSIVSLSGLPGVGKSTIIELMKTEIGSSVLFLPEFLEPFPRKFIDEGDFNQVDIQFWVMKQHLMKQELAKNLSPKPVVLDRCIVDSLAYSFAMGGGVYKKSLAFVQEQKDIPPITVLYLEASLDTIRERITSRNREELSYTIEETFLQKLALGYQQLEEIEWLPITIIKIDAEGTLPTTVEKVRCSVEGKY